MKRWAGALLSPLVLLSCGDGEKVDSQAGVARYGGYVLTLFAPAVVESPAVESVNDQTGEVVIPDDRVSGELTLAFERLANEEVPYSYAYVRKIEVCVGGVCYRANPSSTLLPIQSGDLTAQSSDSGGGSGGGGGGGSEATQGVAWEAVLSGRYYKTAPPWVVVNPYEDEVSARDAVSYELVAPSSVAREVFRDAYSNSSLSVTLQGSVVPGTLHVYLGVPDDQGTNKPRFSATTVVNYTYGSTAVVALPRGSIGDNAVVPQTVVITDGSVVCVDDGGGNIVDLDQQQSNCSGGINYATGDLQFSIAGTGTAQVSVSYDVEGYLLCSDDGAGNLAGDCSGSVDYQSGAVTNVVFAYPVDSVPSDITIFYSVDGVNANVFSLPVPPPVRSGFRDVVFSGRVRVFDSSSSSLLCTESFASSCEVQIDDTAGVVSVVFSVAPPQRITVELEREYVWNLNPSVDAKALGHRVSDPLVRGEVRAEVALPNGRVMRVSRDIFFLAVPAPPPGDTEPQ